MASLRQWAEEENSKLIDLIELNYSISTFLKLSTFLKVNYRVSPIIRPTRKIRPSVIFEDDFNVSPTLKISPS